MVQSYRGIITKVDKKSAPQPVAVAHYMSRKLITFSPDQPMYEVVKTLLKKKISGAPVMDEHGQLCGVISEGDCLKEVVKGQYNNMPNLAGKVSEHMTTNVITISPDMNVFDAADMFLGKRIRRFPVVAEGKLVGQISQKDIMRAVLSMKSATWGK
ncbi:MAG: CBS domain-containing protein [Cytophagales bacterium]|nr:CBS domain-containing protein [Cytophagales bacterium]